VTEAKITKGEWFAHAMTMSRKDWASLHAKELDIVRRGSDVIAAVWCGDDVEGGEQANARLISAAPEMFEALKEVVKWNGLRDGGDDLLPPEEQLDPEIARAMRALSKALGKEG
jgi:hypothetical protein